MNTSTLRRSMRAYQRDVKIAQKHPEQRASIVRQLFMTSVADVGRINDRRCQHTIPLFPLWLILDADGTLAGDMRGLVERTRA